MQLHNPGAYVRVCASVCVCARACVCISLCVCVYVCPGQNWLHRQVALYPQEGHARIKYHDPLRLLRHEPPVKEL